MCYCSNIMYVTKHAWKQKFKKKNEIEMMVCEVCVREAWMNWTACSTVYLYMHYLTIPGKNEWKMRQGSSRGWLVGYEITQ